MEPDTTPAARPAWQHRTVANTQVLFAEDNQPHRCTCGQALRRFEGAGAGGYVNGYSIWAATRRDANTIFDDTPRRHDVLERQWVPSDPIKVSDRRHPGTHIRKQKAQAPDDPAG